MAHNSLFSKLVLYPVSLVYGMVVRVRNKLFDTGLIKQREFAVPTIVVGNISAGGTGKTPMVEYIVEQLSGRYRAAVLSRGYKRRTKGFVLASRGSTPADIGDEPYQIFRKYGPDVPVAVCESRVEGIERLCEEHPDIDLVILDDAFQHRYVKPTLSVVLTEFAHPVFRDSLIPYGRLREPARSMERADIVVVSKCPDEVNDRDIMLYKEDLNLMPYQDMFFTNISYGTLRPVFPDKAPKKWPRLTDMTDHDMILTVAGIGNPRPFVAYVKQFKAHVWVNVFPDHHEFDCEDMTLIESRFHALTGMQNFIVTTEKDAVRLANSDIFPESLKPFIYFLPVKVGFLRDEAPAFIAKIDKAIKKYRR